MNKQLTIEDLQKYKEELTTSKKKSRRFLREIGLFDKNNKLTEWGENVAYAMSIPNKYNQ